MLTTLTLCTTFELKQTERSYGESDQFLLNPYTANVENMVSS